MFIKCFSGDDDSNTDTAALGVGLGVATVFMLIIAGIVFGLFLYYKVTNN